MATVVLPDSAPEVTSYFAELAPATEHEFVGADDARLRVTSYLTETPPPTLYVRSVRCVVLRDNTVLALHRQDRAHVIPGGRRERDESLLQTLERELLEEAGWTTTAPIQIGVVRLNWLTPLPPAWSEASHFHPDFLWLIHAAHATEHRPEALQEEMEDGAPIFLSLDDPHSLSLLDRSPWALENRTFLAEAVRQLRSAPR
jgi:8-oxo-dGTP pyrophosphatase MutT (NUDIX family)